MIRHSKNILSQHISNFAKCKWDQTREHMKFRQREDAQSAKSSILSSNHNKTIQQDMSSSKITNVITHQCIHCTVVHTSIA